MQMQNPLPKRKLGRQGLEVSAIGFGAMSIGIADVYSSSLKDEQSAIDLLHRALDLGVTLIDTANIYGDSELKVGKALKNRRDQAILATKFGITGATVGRTHGVSGRPEYVRQCAEESLKRLGVEVIDLYYQHRIDPTVPIEDTVGAMAELVKQGKVRYLGLSEAAPSTIRRAHKVHPISALQTEYSLWSRDPEDEILPTVRELGIGFVPYSPLGRGFLAGRFRKPEDLAPNDWRRGSPRFQGENFAKNLAVLEQIEAIARAKGCTPSQLALAWVLAQGDDLVPIPGTSSAERLEENVGAAGVGLTAGELQRIEAVAPQTAVAGARHNEAGAALVNH
jgi:aryl-alcohol dehydrogenase-like predicted oxidoreductase